jgi:hypothetical protein
MEPAESAIRDRAYQIWEREGRPHGRERAHWQQATEELMREAGAVDADDMPQQAPSALPAPTSRPRTGSTSLAPSSPRRRGSKKRGNGLT